MILSFNSSIIYAPNVVIDARKRRTQQSENLTSQATSDTQRAQHNNTQSSLFIEQSRSSKRKTAEQGTKLTKAQVKEIEKKKEEEVQTAWKRMAELQGIVDKVLSKKSPTTEDLERSVTEWLFEAEKIIEGFRETRMLFITSSVRAFILFESLYSRPAAISHIRIIKKFVLQSEFRGGQLQPQMQTRRKK